MASYDREWGPTCRFAEQAYGPGTLIGEFPLQTGGRRRVDGILIRGGSRFDAVQWKELSGRDQAFWSGQLRGARVVVIQTKLTVASRALLGQTLLSRLLVEDRFQPTTLDAVALASGRDTEVDEVIRRRFPGLRVEVDPESPARGPRLEPKRDPALRAGYAARALQGWVAHEGFMITARQRVEALYVHDTMPARSRADLAGREVVLVHTAQKPHLDLLGHAIFSAELARDAGAASVSSRLVVRLDDPDLTTFLPQFPDVEVIVTSKAAASGP